MGLFPKDSDFGLSNAQSSAVKELFGAVARKKAALMKREMAAAQAARGERRLMRFADGNGGEVALMVHPMSYHYWGNRLGYQCWEDAGFCREYWRDNPEARVVNRAEALTVIVPGQGGLAASGKKRFSKVYGDGAHGVTRPTLQENSEPRTLNLEPRTLNGDGSHGMTSPTLQEARV